MPKSNDFQILIEWMYLPSFRWIDKIPFKLSSGQASPSKKRHFWSCDLSDWLKCHCSIFKKIPQGYCLNLPNLKRIRLTPEPAEPEALPYTNKLFRLSTYAFPIPLNIFWSYKSINKGDITQKLKISYFMTPVWPIRGGQGVKLTGYLDSPHMLSQ